MGCHASKDNKKQGDASTNLQIPNTQYLQQSQSEQLNKESSKLCFNPTASPTKSALRQKNSQLRSSSRKVMFSPCFEPKIREFEELSVPHQFDLINS